MPFALKSLTVLLELGSLHLKAGKYMLTPASHPTHAEILKKLLLQDGIDPRWKKRIAAKLQELGAGE